MGCCQCSARGVPLQRLGSLASPGAIPRRNSALKIVRGCFFEHARDSDAAKFAGCGHPVRRQFQCQSRCLRGASGLVQVARDDGTRERGCQWPGCRRRQGVGTVAHGRFKPRLCGTLRRTMTVPRQGLPLADFNLSNAAQAQAAGGSRAESEPLA
jgi:hypothetical protein